MTYLQPFMWHENEAKYHQLWALIWSRSATHLSYDPNHTYNVTVEQQISLRWLQPTAKQMLESF